MTAQSEAKKKLRVRMRARRDALDAATRARHSRIITGKLLALPEWQAADALAAYVSFGSEFDTAECLAAALASGKRLLLPRIDQPGRRLELRQADELGDNLSAGPWGIREPNEQCPPRAASSVEFVLVPALAINPRGARLGYGGGYYDRLLAEIGPSALRVAAVFEAQMVEEIPLEPHDLPMDVLLTETRVIRLEK